MSKCFKRTLAIFLAVIMTFGAAPLAGFVGLDLPDLKTLFATKAEAATYNGTCGDNLTWTLDTVTGELVISGTGDMTDWFTYSSVPWYGSRSRITSVTIGDGVTSIGDYAFDYCAKLTSLAVPDSVKRIGEYAFANCSVLASVSIGKGVTIISNRVFENCSALASITVDSANTVYSSDEYGVLFNKDKTKLIQYPVGSTRTSYEISDSVTEICAKAFYRCYGLTSLKIGDGVTKIGDSAFYDCDKITDLTIGNSVKTIGKNAFSYCASITSITIPDSVTTIGYFAFSYCSAITSITIPDSVTNLGNSAFTSCGSLKDVILGNGIKRINEQTFFTCSALTNITIGNNVKTIGENAFYSCSKLASVEIPDSVTEICDDAFDHCTSLTSVKIGNGVKRIGNSAFDYCLKLTEVTIPDSVTFIGASAFYHCDALTSVKIGNGVTTIGGSAFSMCVALSDLTLGNSVTKIGNSAFSSCDGIKNVTIPDSVTTLGDSAFGYCEGLVSVTIPAGVTSIGKSAFSSCISLTSITVDPNNPAYSSDEYGVLFNKDKTELIQYPLGNTRTSYEIPDSVTSIGNNSFRKGTSLTTVTIPDSVTSIGNSAFYGCTNLTSAAIPNGVETIGEEAFRECSKLASIIIPDSVTSLGEEAFYGCSKATSLTIGNGITSIGVSVFESCNRVTSITIPETITSIGDEAFKNCNYITTITIPGNVKTIGNSAFYNCYNLTSVIISDGVTSIGNEAFISCGALTSVTIADSVTSIGDRAFSDCYELADITIPDTVISIGNEAFLYTAIYDDTTNWENGVLYISNHLIKAEPTLSESYTIKEGTKAIAAYAFSECVDLFEVIIPDGATSIGASAFNGCTSLYIVSAPDSITNIGDSAFYGCQRLEDFTIPVNATSIGDYAFYDCQCLDDIVIPDGITSIGAYWFYDCDLLTNITIHNKVTSIGDFAFYNCYNLRSITIPDSVTSIGFRAFAECTGLTSITIPDSVTSLGNYVFQNCTGLTSVKISNSLTTISESAFEKCSHLTNVTIPDSVTTIERDAFMYCYRLESITIPDSVTSIGAYTFYDCEKLTNVTIPDGVTTINTFTFGYCDSLENITIPDSVNDISYYAFQDSAIYNNPDNWENGMLYIGKHFIKAKNTDSGIYSIKEGTVTIAECAFDDCSNLISVTIPDGITRLPYRAFAFCSMFESVTIPASVTTIDREAFNSCVSLSDVYYAGTENKWNAITIDVDNEPLLDATIHFASPYVLTLDANGGWFDWNSGEIYSIEYMAGEKITPVYEPEKPGFNFAGWENESGELLYDLPEYMPAYDVTLRAVWEPCSYTVIYDAEGGCFSDGTEIISIDQNYGEKLSVPYSAPARPGYIFKGWAQERDSDIIVDIENMTMPIGDITFYAMYVPCEDTVYTVETYMMNRDGEYELTETITYAGMTDCEVEYTPYEIDGFTVSPDSVLSGIVMGDGSLLLQVFYNRNRYVANFDYTYDFISVECYYDSIVEEPEMPLREGYIFDGWVDCEGNRVEFPYVMPANDVHFEAVFYACEYTVRYDLSGGFFSNGEYERTEVYRYGDVVDTYEHPCREGYSFAGWVDAETYMPIELPFTIIDRDINLLATWVINEYEIYFNDGFGDLVAHYSAEYGTEISHLIYETTIPEREGHTFVGWMDEETGEFLSQGMTMPCHELHFVAMWTVNEYVVHWFAEGVYDEEIIYRYGEDITVPNIPAKEGYVFAGWSPEVPITMPAENMEFVAIWEPAGPVTYNVETYIMDTTGEYNSITVSHSVEKAGNVSVNPVISEGFKLNNSLSVLEGYAEFGEQLTLKVYLDRIPYKLTRNIDGKSFTTEYLYGSIIAKPADPSKDGYIFIGWEGEIPGTMPANDVTITAKFREVTPEDNIEYEISLHITPLNNVTLNYGESIKLQAYPQYLPAGYGIRWSADSSCVELSVSANGRICIVTSVSSGGAAITAWIVDENGQKVTDKNGNVIKDTEVLYSEVNTWLMIINFFKKLFGLIK